MGKVTALKKPERDWSAYVPSGYASVPPQSADVRAAAFRAIAEFCLTKYAKSVVIDETIADRFLRLVATRASVRQLAIACNLNCINVVGLLVQLVTQVPGEES